MRNYPKRTTTNGREQMTLGVLIDALSKMDADKNITFDFGGFYAHRVQSWRGAYEELAIGYAKYGESGAQTVGELLARLTAAVGATYEGWKGGDYTMERSTPLWVANPGESTNTVIDGILDEPHWAYLLTSHCDY
jgi:hypothetical protein